MFNRMSKRIAALGIAAVIVLGSFPGALAAGNVIVKMDFENFAEGAALKGTTNWDVKLFEGDSCVIETDPVSGSKAIKFTKGGTTDNAYMEYTLPQVITEGIVKVSYDARIASATKYNQLFGVVRNNVWSNYFSASIRGANLNNGDAGVIGNMRDIAGNEWRHYEQIIDIKGGTLEYRIYKDDGEIFSYNVSGLNKNDVRRLIFAAYEDHLYRCNAWECTYQTGNDRIPNTTDPAGVVYVDNIIFEQVGMEITSVLPPNGSTDVSAEEDVKVSFNTEPAENIAEFLEIYKNGEKMEGGYAAVNSGKESAIVFDEGLSYDTQYSVTVKAGASAKNSAYAPIAQDYTFEFTTENIIPQDIGVEEGKRYNEKISAEFSDYGGITVSAELSKDGGEFLPYISGTLIDEEGNYVLRIIARKNGKEQVKDISFMVVGLVPPRAEDVVITQDGLKLTGSYTFIDDNGDKEEGTVVRWLKSDSPDGEFKEVEGVSGAEYEITEADIDQYIKFGVTPRSDKEPFGGEEFLSGAFVLPAKPAVEGEVKINGEMKLGSELSAEYKYFDKNEGDVEEGTLFAWYRTDSEGNIKERIEGADKSSYTISEADVDCYIVCGVTPKNNGIFGMGEEYKSKPLMCLFSPQVLNLKITGSVTAGKSVGAAYTFSDKNYDKEGESKVEWYVNGKLVSEDMGYTIEKGESGTLLLKVTPVSQQYPYEGETAEVSANISKGTGGGSGHSGGGTGGTGLGGVSVSSGNGAVNVTPTPQPSKEEEDKEPENPQKELLDISGHWAKSSIEALFKKGIVTGDDNLRFNPDKKITRAEMAALVVRALNLEGEYQTLYTDVNGTEWYADVVCAVSSAGIMKGDAVSFRPDDFITREELCVMLVNALKYEGIETISENITFADSEDVSDWAEESLKICVGMELIQGVGDNMAAPKASATKAQAAVIIDKMLGKMEERVR